MIFGGVLARLRQFRLDAADGQAAVVRNTTASRLALRLFGVPHMGLRIRARLVLSEISKLRPDSIIDAGSGNGLYTLELAARGFEVFGLELDEQKVVRVAAYLEEAGICNAKVTQADLTKPDAPARRAEVVICSDVLEHIEDDLGAIATLRSLVKPGGTLIVTVPRISPFASKVENSFDHVRIGYAEQQLCGLLEAAGFRISRTAQFFKRFGRIAWAADRSFRESLVLKVLAFWPLFLFAKLDALIASDRDAGGLLVVARAPLGH